MVRRNYLRAGEAAHQAAAVGQRALAEDLEVARLVHRLRAEEHLHLVEVLVHLPEPLGREVGGDHLDLGEERRDLALRALEVVGERLQLVPGDVARGAPLAGGTPPRTERDDVVGPDLVLLVVGVAHVGHVGVDDGAARRHRARGRRVFGFAGVGVVDVLER